MTDTTTIEITKDQKAELAALKQHARESYKTVIQRLLDGSDADDVTTKVVPLEQIQEQRVVELEATTIRSIGDEIEERLR